jgi:hypothetical protein
MLALTKPDADFVAHLPPTNDPARPTDLIDPVLDRLHDLLAGHDHEYEASKGAEARHLRSVAHSTAGAASLVTGAAANLQPAFTVGTALRHEPWWDGPLPATAARRLWWAAADCAARSAFKEAYYRARTADPRLEPRWRQAEMHQSSGHSYAPPFDLFLDHIAFMAAARAGMKASTAEEAWDDAVDAARAKTPWWIGLENALAGLLSADQLERSWQAGRRHLARTRPLARRVATIAAAAEPAARICDLAGLAAVRQRREDDLQVAFWSATDRLIDRICEHP